MASPQPPDAHLRPPPHPPESHPRSSTQQHPLEQHGSDPRDLPSCVAKQVSPMRNPREHFLQQHKGRELTGEFTAQVSLSEGREAEHQRNKQTGEHHVEEKEVDLARIMESLQIAIPEGIEVGYQGR